MGSGGTGRHGEQPWRQDLEGGGGALNLLGLTPELAAERGVPALAEKAASILKAINTTHPGNPATAAACAPLDTAFNSGSSACLFLPGVARTAP